MSGGAKNVIAVMNGICAVGICSRWIRRSDVTALALLPMGTVVVFQFLGMSAWSAGVNVGVGMMRFPLFPVGAGMHAERSVAIAAVVNPTAWRRVIEVARIAG